MKKILFLIFLLFPVPIFAISASSYIVMDQNSGRVLEGSNLHSPRLIASISKIMTAIVAIEYGNIEETITVDDCILSSFGSGIYINVGEKLTLDDLLYGLMLRSGNDAALQIASSVAGSKEAFVYLMNEKAATLGMEDSSFVNPSGLEENDGSANKSTVYDMAILMQYAMQNEHFRRIVSTKNITVKSSTKTYSWTNKNKLLHSYPFITGGKTGYTEKARRTLVTSASKEDMSLIVVTFNDGNDFEDHKTLYEKYFSSYENKKVLSKEETYGENVYIQKDFYVLSTSHDSITTNIEMDSIKNPYNGQIVGKINVLLNGEPLGYRYLYYKKELVNENKGFLSKLLDCLRRYL